MSLFSKIASQKSYLSSIDPANRNALIQFQHRMSEYYLTSPYHSNWIKGLNVRWQNGVHDAQLSMCKLIPDGATVLEVGCGDGSAAQEISTRVKEVLYTGVDLSAQMWEGRQDFNFMVARAEQLPFSSASFDVVLSMFVIEHLVFPSSFLDEAWRVLKPGGKLITIAPDFDANAMPSEKNGFSYGTGRTKLLQGKLLDALMTFYDSRIRLPFLRFKRRNKIGKFLFEFPIFVEPRCLQFSEFITDCDAVYPVSSQEIVNYLEEKTDYKDQLVFYRNSSTFGLLITKK
ncbi:class I SAM-dependent methyltransferase [Nostoc sp. UHCC 0702]|nr:class I SAM-dependent methyltransferase [Nostoc sp. UHCC 0702]